ncbi:MAG: hypothetical protein LBR20_05825 [Propionibacteriaceae bacterium]|jgi:hypothetical protein|nr:hypothetical protein [Propionibacteriaceae bacterium]
MRSKRGALLLAAFALYLPALTTVESSHATLLTTQVNLEFVNNIGNTLDSIGRISSMEVDQARDWIYVVTVDVPFVIETPSTGGVYRISTDGVLDTNYLVRWSDRAGAHTPQLALQVANGVGFPDTDRGVLISGSESLQITWQYNGVLATAPSPCVARIKLDGELDLDFAAKMAASGVTGAAHGVVYDYFEETRTDIYLAGQITYPIPATDTQPATTGHTLMKLKQDGDVDYDFARQLDDAGGTPPGMDGEELTISPQTGNVFMGTSLDGPYVSIFKVNRDGTPDTIVNEAMADYQIEARGILLSPTTNDFAIAGQITMPDGTEHSFAIFDQYANLLAAYDLLEFYPNPNYKFDNIPGMDSENRIFVGPQATSEPGKYAIARINTDGTIEQQCKVTAIFEGTPGDETFNGMPRMIDFDADGNMIVAGRFTSVDGIPIERIVKLTEELDSDGDGLCDARELASLADGGTGTDPDNPDTDGGGADDFTEVRYGTNPLDPSDDYKAKPGTGIITESVTPPVDPPYTITCDVGTCSSAAPYEPDDSPSPTPTPTASNPLFDVDVDDGDGGNSSGGGDDDDELAFTGASDGIGWLALIGVLTVLSGACFLHTRR